MIFTKLFFHKKGYVKTWVIRNKSDMVHKETGSQGNWFLGRPTVQRSPSRTFFSKRMGKVSKNFYG